jgi:hypothetical protein
MNTNQTTPIYHATRDLIATKVAFTTSQDPSINRNVHNALLTTQ